MTKHKWLIVITLMFAVIIGLVFFITFKLADKAKQQSQKTQVVQTEQQVAPTTKQIRKISLKNIDTGELMEVNMDGTVNYFDKTGKLKKSGRRGFLETQFLFRGFENIINGGQTIGGKSGYVITIETEQGLITIDPGNPGGGGTIIDDIIDHIDDTLNPTPSPTWSPTPRPSPTTTPTPSIDPSPDPSTPPDYSTAPPFKCSDYYKSGGKPIKISNVYCGLE